MFLHKLHKQSRTNYYSQTYVTQQIKVESIFLACIGSERATPVSLLTHQPIRRSLHPPNRLTATTISSSSRVFPALRTWTSSESLPRRFGVAFVLSSLRTALASVSQPRRRSNRTSHMLHKFALSLTSFPSYFPKFKLFLLFHWQHTPQLEHCRLAVYILLFARLLAHETIHVFVIHMPRDDVAWTTHAQGSRTRRISRPDRNSNRATFSMVCCVAPYLATELRKTLNCLYQE